MQIETDRRLNPMTNFWADHVIDIPVALLLPHLVRWKWDKTSDS
jgi:hypothetical protein